MGTSAVFAIKSDNDRFYMKIIGMTMDGFTDNLKFIAGECERIAKTLRCATAFRKREKSAVYRVMKNVINEHPNWLFVDSYGNASWVGYSSLYDPKTKEIKLFEGLMEHEIKEDDLISI
jgi:hypothetical protein